MKTSYVVAFVLAISVASGIAAGAVAAQEAAPATYPYRHHHIAHHRIPAVRNSVAPPPAAASLARPAVPPAPKVENDSDGLSRDPEDCNMGCLDNTE